MDFGPQVKRHFTEELSTNTRDIREMKPKLDVTQFSALSDDEEDDEEDDEVTSIETPATPMHVILFKLLIDALAEIQTFTDDQCTDFYLNTKDVFLNESLATFGVLSQAELDMNLPELKDRLAKLLKIKSQDDLKLEGQNQRLKLLQESIDRMQNTMKILEHNRQNLDKANVKERNQLTAKIENLGEELYNLDTQESTTIGDKETIETRLKQTQANIKVLEERISEIQTELSTHWFLKWFSEGEAEWLRANPIKRRVISYTLVIALSAALMGTGHLLYYRIVNGARMVELSEFLSLLKQSIPTIDDDISKTGAFKTIARNIIDILESVRNDLIIAQREAAFNASANANLEVQVASLNATVVKCQATLSPVINHANNITTLSGFLPGSKFGLCMDVMQNGTEFSLGNVRAAKGWMPYLKNLNTIGIVGGYVGLVYNLVTFIRKRHIIDDAKAKGVSPGQSPSGSAEKRHLYLEDKIIADTIRRLDVYTREKAAHLRSDLLNQKPWNNTIADELHKMLQSYKPE